MPPDPVFSTKSPAASPFLAGFEPTTFRLGVSSGRVIGVMPDARKVKEYQAFLPLRYQSDASL